MRIRIGMTTFACLLLLGIAPSLPAQTPGNPPRVEKKPTVVDPADADVPATTPTTGNLPQKNNVPPVQKTIEVPPAKIAPTVPGVPPKASAEEPKPAKITVKESQPAGAPVAPPDGKPDLSAPAPPPETLVYVPKDRYYMMIFGSESVPKRPKYTHTWMTIVKATPKPNQKDAYDVLAHTISWLPRTLDVRVLRLRAECGVNLDLQRTLNTVRCNGECVAMWGPYELNPTVAVDLYDKTVRQIARLNSGRVLYKARDPDYYPQATYICDCIHAVTDMDGIGRRGGLYDENQRYGLDASYNLARVMWRANRLDTSTTHNWLVEALDLQKYRIQQRLLPKPPAVRQPVTAQDAAAAAE